MTSVKILMQLAAAYSSHVKVLILQVLIYMRQSTETYTAFDDNPLFIAKLSKCIYGLRQACALWNKHLHNSITAFDFSTTLPESCVYYYITKERVLSTESFA